MLNRQNIESLYIVTEFKQNRNYWNPKLSADSKKLPTKNDHASFGQLYRMTRGITQIRLYRLKKTRQISPETFPTNILQVTRKICILMLQLHMYIYQQRLYSSYIPSCLPGALSLS
jgi:hypothetical protein